MALQPGLILVGLIFLVIGIPHLIFSLLDWRKDKKLLATGARAEGTIESSVTWPDDDRLQSGQHRYHAHFLDEQGIGRCAKSRFADSDPEGQLHRKVTVVYDPKNPDHSRFEHDLGVSREVIEHLSVLTLGLILFFLGVFL